MAEERIIDDDEEKNEKYKIDVGENVGEEMSGGESQAKAEEPSGAEEKKVLSAKEEQALLYEQEKREYVEKLIKDATADYKAGRYQSCIEALDEAEDIDDENGEVYALKMCAYTHNFTEFRDVIKAAESAAGVKKYTAAEKKAEMRERAQAGIAENCDKLKKEIKVLERENNEKKSERAVVFKKARNIALIVFICMFVPLATFSGLAGYFSTLIYTESTGHFFMLTCVFGGLAGAFLIAAVFAARWLNITSRRLRLNGRDSSTKIGRQLIIAKSRLNAFNAISLALE